MKIPSDIIPFAYKIAKQVYNNEISLRDGKLAMVSCKTVNINSSADYINNYRYLIEGKKFSRTLNFESMEYFLENIYFDNGSNGLQNALLALKKHIEYYEKIQNTTMHKMRELVDKFSSTSFANSLNDKQQNEVVKILISENQTKTKIIEQLLALNPIQGKTIIFKGKSYKRDNVAIGLIKVLRDLKCQFCGHSITKKDGTKYVEAAHIKPKHIDGSETIENIILLCPNHHKEFDLGDRKILKHTKKFIDLTLNGKPFHIDFEN